MELLCLAILSQLLLESHVQAVRQSQKPASAYFQICHKSDPDISTCIKNTIQDMRPKLITGIPELKLVPLEPLVIPRLEFNEGTGNFRFSQVLTNVTIRGLGAFRLRNVKMDLSTLTLDLDILTPSMVFNADYEMDGRILLVPLNGKGDCVLNFTDVTTAARTVYKVVNRDGQEFLDVEDIKWTIDAGHCSIYFNNLFGGDKILGDTTNRFLNANWREALKTYKYLPEEAFGVLFKDLTNKVLKHFPYKEIFPE